MAVNATSYQLDVRCIYTTTLSADLAGGAVQPLLIDSLVLIPDYRRSNVYLNESEYLHRCIGLHIYTYTHTYIHTYNHTYIHTWCRNRRSAEVGWKIVLKNVMHCGIWLGWRRYTYYRKTYVLHKIVNKAYSEDF